MIHRPNKGSKFYEEISFLDLLFAFYLNKVLLKRKDCPEKNHYHYDNTNKAKFCETVKNVSN